MEPSEPPFPDNPIRRPNRLQAGIISRMRLENFMCHSNLEIVFGDMVNFLTGQNGSGKSAILTALCVAFGCRARGTQRANTQKDFIKTGCSYALVHVEIKNQGEYAFKHGLYGDIIILERRITESSGTTTLKNYQGRRVGTKKEDVLEIVKYFNIDVENPCTIMSQDKSREFLHSGSGKDKFKFFYKATLLQRVEDILHAVERLLSEANGLLSHHEDSLKPAMKELDELQEKIKSMEYMEEISQQVELLRKQLAWSWVYDADRKLDEQLNRIEKLKGRIPSCQERIDQNHHMMEELTDQLAKKKQEISSMMERTSEVRRMKEELEQNYSLAWKEKLELEQQQGRLNRQTAKLVQQGKSLEMQIRDMHDQFAKNTQAEENEMEERLMKLQVEVDEANVNIKRFKEEEDDISQRIALLENDIEVFSNQIEDVEKSYREISSRIRELQMNQKNKVTAFGGVRVTNLLKVIERNQHKFSIPPIGPIGAHVKLEHGDMWAVAIETAVGRLLNAFIVTDHKDSRILRECAREANYNNLQIIIHDFRRPRINIPAHMLPQTNHPTALSVLHSDNSTVLNVLVDMANAERQVLVKDYDVGKTVAFDQRIPNLKEVYTSDGYKMFYRSSAQTVLPPNRNLRGGRLSGSFDNQIKYLERDASETKVKAQQGRGLKRAKEEELMDLRNNFNGVKRRRLSLERHVGSKRFELEDVKKLLSAEANAAPASALDDLQNDLSKVHDEIRDKEALLTKLKDRVYEAGNKAAVLKMSFENLCESAKSDIDALAEAENKLMIIEHDLIEVERVKKHYESVMHTKVLAELKDAEALYQELEQSCQESRKKASIISPESEIEALGGCEESKPEKLSCQLTRLTERLKRETQRFPESIDDIRMLFEKKNRKISRKRQNLNGLWEKLEACQEALESKWIKFQRNATLLKRQLTWQFNGHLKKKGFSGQINVDYEEQTLSIEVKMPQDASNSAIRDTSGLSGGERSFSTLCFALALHEMTEAPFRAMDEFDVFMDAVSRKISLDALVDFALAHGSQWIFITPHDISMVKNDERIKKQQLAAPRG